MIDEPYVPLLPWVVFAIVEGTTRNGNVWAAAAACVVATLLLIGPRSASVGLPNILMLGAIGWFGAFAVVAWFWGDPGSWLARNSLAVSAVGFTVIAYASLMGTPFTEYWTRFVARRRHWSLPSFRRANVHTSMLWGTVFALAAVSHLVAAALDSSAANTIFNWLVPLGIGVVGAYHTRQIWIDFIEQTAGDGVGPETLWGLTYDDVD